MVSPKGHKKSRVGLIPSDWECAQLVEVIKDISMGPFGSDITVSNFTSSGVPVLSGKNVSTIRLNDDIANYVTESKANSLKKAVARRGDIVVTHRGTLGQISYIPLNSKYSNYVISQSQFRVTFNDSVDVRFLVYFFHTSQGQSYLLEGKGHTGVPAIAQPTTTFRKLYIPLPRKNEQQYIADALSDADSLTASLQKLIAKKKAIKQGSMQELLTGKRRLPGFSGEWSSCCILDVLDRNVGIKIGPFGSQLKKEFLLEYGRYKIYGQENIYSSNFMSGSRYLSDERYQKLKSCEILAGDFLISSMGTIGKCAVVPEGIIPGIMDSHLIRFRFDNKRVLTHYMIYLFSSEFSFLKTQIGRLSVGGIMDGLSTKIVSALQIIIPKDIKEQTAIAKILSDMDAEIEQLEKKLLKYQQIKQGMIQELLTGRIRLINTVKARTHDGDASIMSGIAALFYSEDDPEKYPLGRKKVQKLMYITLRREGYDVSDFMKMAAGPYSPNVRYNSEPIAIERGYIITEEGDIGTKFIRGNNADEAKEHMLSWVPQETIHWLLSNFRRIGVNDLELFATVDMAICDLREMQKPVSVQSIKELIHSIEEWRKKLEKPYFSDLDIQRAISKCREFFGEQ